MQISTILDHIDSGYMALPEFQRGYVWNRDQVRGLMDSLYRRHPVGSLLVWATQSVGAEHRGDAQLAPGVVKLLLDGQQRITSLYGIVRGKAPAFFEGNEQTFTGLYFHLGTLEFRFYQPMKMKDDPLWINVSDLMAGGNDGLGAYVTEMSKTPELAPNVGEYVARMSRILGIRDIELHVEEVTGADKSIDVVVDIFNRVNSGGTKLSKGDLALAKICAEWPAAREKMRSALLRWKEAGFHFKLEWLLRNVNTVVTGEAKFSHLHGIESDQFRDGLDRATRAIDTLLNLIEGRLGLDHDRVFFGRYALPVMVHYLDRRGHLDDAAERDRLIYWYVHNAMWGRYSGSTESVMDSDLKLIEDLDGGLERLTGQLRLWHGSLRVLPDHFTGWSLGARFYPVLYMLTRIGEAKDWGTGLPLKSQMLGKMSQLEVHHIFPKKYLYDYGYSRADVNAVANYCFLTKDTNIQIGATPPLQYFSEVEKKHPGGLASQWVPMDTELWKIENYPRFLEERRRLLAKAANDFFDELAHGEAESAEQVPEVRKVPVGMETKTIPGGVDTKDEEEQLIGLMEWLDERGLPEGEYLYELADQVSGEPLAILDLAWPDGLQEGYSQAVAVLLNEGAGHSSGGQLPGLSLLHRHRGVSTVRARGDLGGGGGGGDRVASRDPVPVPKRAQNLWRTTRREAQNTHTLFQ